MLFIKAVKGEKCFSVLSSLHARIDASRTAVSFKSWHSVLHCMLGDALAAGQRRVWKCLLKVSDRQA